MTKAFHGIGNRRCLASVAACILYLMCSQTLLAQSANNSGIDTRPPVIELEELAEGFADNTQVFTVQIAEETELQDATLYYRRDGQQPYTSVAMQPLGSSGFYTASVSTDPTDLRSIEYYVQARDTSGNRTVSGFAFDPYSRQLSPARSLRTETAAVVPTPNADVSSPSLSTTPFYKKRWVQITMGVVAAGVIASALDNEAEDVRIVPVNIRLE